MRRVLSLIALAVLLSPVASADDPPWLQRSKRGLVASDSAAASRVGARVLKEGGNAFDAAVATSLALGVTRPFSTGLGGGGFMVAYLADEQRVVALDFRETAPAAADPNRYAARAADPNAPPASVYGGDAIGVPGLLAGMVKINADFGTRPLAQLAAPAIKLAEEGFEVDDAYRNAAEHIVNVYARWPQLKQHCAPLGRLFLTGGQPPPVGQRVRNLPLGAALRLIARDGADAFYRGPIGAAIVASAAEAGGALTAADLAGYRVRERMPIVEKIGAYDVASMPPPSSGGIALVQAWKTLALRRTQVGEQITPPLEMHLRIEALKHAFADRARWLGDPDFVSIPVKRLTSNAYAQELAERIAVDKAGSPAGYGIAQLPDDAGTSHFCVADAAGNVVALTETINATFGSFVVAGEYGFALNNEMDDFVTTPGKANLYGLVQSEANLVAPGKRPLSSMTPTIVLRKGRPVLALGASGGPRIISSVLHVAANALDISLPLASAVVSVRPHHQWRPDEVYFDIEPPEQAVAALRKLGHRVSDEQRGGVVQAIQVLDDGTLVGVSDPRKGGRPVGVD